MKRNWSNLLIENIVQKIELDRNLIATIEKNKVVGKITYTLNGKQIASVNIISKNEITKISTWNMIKYVLSKWFYLCR